MTPTGPTLPKDKCLLWSSANRMLVVQPSCYKLSWSLIFLLVRMFSAISTLVLYALVCATSILSSSLSTMIALAWLGMHARNCYQIGLTWYQGWLIFGVCAKVHNWVGPTHSRYHIACCFALDPSHNSHHQHLCPTHQNNLIHSRMYSAWLSQLVSLWR